MKNLDLRGNALTDQGVTELFQYASVAFQSLESLELGENRIGGKGIASVLGTLAKSGKVNISFSNNPLEAADLKIFRDALCCHQLTKLETLDLSGSLSRDPDANATLILVLALGHCRGLKSLNLSGNCLRVSSGRALGRVLPQLLLEELDLGGTSFGDECMLALAQNLEGTCHIGKLNLCSNDIHVAGISHLADSVCAGTVVIKHSL